MNEGIVSLLWKARLAKGSKTSLLELQRKRLSEIVAFARQHSPFYKAHYKSLPNTIDDVTILPVTDKKMLMPRFDEWCTDRIVTLEKAQTFAKDLELVGQKFLDKYTLSTTSGTTGYQGIFLLDESSMKVTSAMAIRMMSSWLSAADIFKILIGRGRLAMVMGTAGHFASAIAASRLEKKRGKNFLALSALRPMSELVEQLNAFQPVILAPYASMAALLASQQEIKKLNITPVLTVLSAEGLPDGEYKRIAGTLNTKVRNSYAATECPFFSYSCEDGWLHVNNDWVLFEAVDEHYKPVPAGKESYTVLITNLANTVQPILRYDLGDSIIVRPDPCPCGNSLPAIKVNGRASDVLNFLKGDEKISVPPLAFSILVDHIEGLEKIQIVQAEQNTLRVRMIIQQGSDSKLVWKKVNDAISSLTNDRGLTNVKILRANEPPEQTSGAKFRPVIPLKKH